MSIRNFQELRGNSQKSYLGFCEQKGYLYSVQIDAKRYSIVAVKGSEVSTLITYDIKGDVQ